MLFRRKMGGNGGIEHWETGTALWNAWRCQDIRVPATLRVSKSLVGGSCFLRMHYALVSRRAHFHRRTMVA
jgi:hypothetical protein